MFGLGKERSKLGEYLDKKGISQRWLEKAAKLSKTTVSHLCSKGDYIPSGSTMKKVLDALRKEGHKVDQKDFWRM